MKKSEVMNLIVQKQELVLKRNQENMKVWNAALESYDYKTIDACKIASSENMAMLDILHNLFEEVSNYADL